MDNSFSSVIDSAASILVLMPVKPNFDEVAAGLSLYLSIHDKKEVTVSCPSPMMVGFNRIIGINKITSELGNKNLTIKFKGYDAGNIEKVSYDIIDGEFNLTVVPKAGFISPQQDQMDLSFSGISADLVILVGGSTDSDFPILASEELANAKVAYIGIRNFSSAREVMSFAVPVSTISEAVTVLVKNNAMSMDPDIATNLVMGIEEGTSNFVSNEVTPDTFEIFAYLLRAGGQRQSRVKLSPMGFPPGAIPNQPFGQSTKNDARGDKQIIKSANVEPVLEQVENKEEVVENPPDDWLQPKVFKGSAVPQQSSDSFSENKG